MDINIILKEIRDGNKETFERLFHKYYERLVIYAERFLFDRASSEDLVQEVFIHFWENSKSIHITTSLKAYLYRMVRNKGLNYLKSLKLTDDLESVNYSNEHDFFYNSIETQEENGLKFKKVIHLVDTMPDRMQEIFNLKYRESYSYAEISNELGISTNTVKTQLKRAKALLKNHFLFPLFFIFFP